MKRTKIGSVDVDLSVNFWTNGKNEGSLRQNERELYTIIDLEQTKAEFCSDDKVDEHFNEMDKAYCALQLINAFNADNDLLYRAGIVLNDAIINGSFDHSYDSIESRNSYINKLVDELIVKTNSNDLADFLSVDFAQWWNDTIVKQNYFINIATGTKTNVPDSRIGYSEKTDEFCAKLKAGGMSLLYIYSSPMSLSTKKSMAKFYDQQEIKESLKAVNPAFTESVCKNLILSGIAKDTEGKTPDDVIRGIKEPKVGDLMAIITLVVTAVVALCGVATAIIAARKSEIDNDTAKILSNGNIQAAAPGDGDFPIIADLDGDGVISQHETLIYNEKKNKTKLIIYGGLALTALYLLMN